VSQPDS